jgi:hypothetical protein
LEVQECSRRPPNDLRDIGKKGKADGDGNDYGGVLKEPG